MTEAAPASSSSATNVCKRHRFTVCCYDTEMVLLDDDVQRIRDLGFKESYFAADSDDGFKMLKNGVQGRCVFHDGKQCTIYTKRPAGCKLYPVIYDENIDRPVKDRLCPFRSEFDLSLKGKQEVTDVYYGLMQERQHNKTRRGEDASTTFLNSLTHTISRKGKGNGDNRAHIQD